MTDYTMALAKRDFKIGYLSTFQIQKAVLSENWNVYLKSDGNANGYLVDARTKKPREFCTIDGAVAAIKQIGFNVEFLTQ